MSNSNLFGYTSGNWTYNDAQRLHERRRVFNVTELIRLAAESVRRSSEDVTSFTKLAEGKANRTFCVTMHDGFKLIMKIPYHDTIPKGNGIASEAATMEFLRAYGMPVPKVYAYSPTAENSAGTEYIAMEFISGRNLENIWEGLQYIDKLTVIENVTELEAWLFAIEFPASGSIYNQQDLESPSQRVEIPWVISKSGQPFCVGPDTRPHLWRGRRHILESNRGPYKDFENVLTAGAKQEITCLRAFGKPLHHVNRFKRRAFDFKKQDHEQYISDLEKYLQAAKHVVPPDCNVLTKPTIRHPNLEFRHIFVSDNLEITGVVDWQNCAVLPLILQCGIPRIFQHDSKEMSMMVGFPELPTGLSEMDGDDQEREIRESTLRSVHSFYLTETWSKNEPHFDAMQEDPKGLLRKIFRDASAPWHGDSVSLRADLIQLKRDWEETVVPYGDGCCSPCPFSYLDKEVRECMVLQAKLKIWDTFQSNMLETVGCEFDGWVEPENFRRAKSRCMLLRGMIVEPGLLEHLERMDGGSPQSPEAWLEHWPFDDRDESEYL
ncbi:kinase-like domain-containing protein [Lineolata rhizophorae]|uniref:Kinase-like domain-containing protein n=1 Tax=Lineolata rhizophorae TaxID=578093 RepID=A0A6A6PDB6_9PEZI|nr:kinase-like domain-containing protein [Lineolata rhizophorae]